MSDIVTDYGLLEAATRRLVEAAEAWDNTLSSYCDGDERDELREAVRVARRCLDD